MKLIPTILFSSVGFSASVFCAQAFSGTLAIFDLAQGAQKSQIKISVQDNLLRIDHLGKPSADQPQLVFDSKSGELLMINEVERSYSRLDKATRESMTQTMKGVKAKMEAQFAAIPPEQKKMMENMMKGTPMEAMFTQEVKKQISYKKTTKTDAASGYTCVMHEKIVDGKKHSEFCISPVEKIQGGNEIYQMMQSVMAIFKEASSVVPMEEEDNPWQDMQALNGFPIIAMRYQQGQVTEKMSLKEISSVKHDPKLFAAPVGYKETKLEMPSFE